VHSLPFQSALLACWQSLMAKIAVHVGLASFGSMIQIGLFLVVVLLPKKGKGRRHCATHFANVNTSLILALVQNS